MGEMAVSTKTVCVTGAAGFIGSWLVKKLLERGYRVRAAVRDPDNASKVAHLKALPFATERLELLKADLTFEGAYDEVVKGCSGVFHTASPANRDFHGPVKDPEAMILGPAEKGTLNMLKSVAKASGVRRVVLTSSIVAILFSKGRTASDVVSEKMWSDPEMLRKTEKWYPLSKTLAEQAAWAFAKEHDIDMVVINPVLTVGKELQPTLIVSNEYVLNNVNGKNKAYPDFAMPWVDVEDVADAHILAYEKPEAEGRYLIIETWLHWREVCTLLKKLEPSATVTQTCAVDPPKEVAPPFDSNKMRSLGITPRPIETTLRSVLSSLKENGHWKA